MQNLEVVINNVNGQNVVSSRTIAEQLGKEHKNVLRDLEKILTSSNVSSLIILSNYEDKKGELRKEYLLTKDGFTLYMFNIQGYQEFKMAYINKFNEMENIIRQKIPTSFKEALKLAYEQQETIENLQLENKVKDQQIAELQPKASYYDVILQCKDLLSTTIIAKDYGMAAKGFNKLLHELGIQYNQSGVWLLYQKYADKGYTQTKTQNYNRPDRTQGAKPHTYWTQKGRLFLYEFLKTHGYLPIIEKEESKEKK